MEKKSKNRANSLEKLLLYLNKFMTGKERNAFEKNIMQNSFDLEALEGIERLSFDEFEADLKEINERLNKYKSKKRIITIPLIRYAAILVLLLSITGILFLLINPKPDINETISQKTESQQSTIIIKDTLSGVSKNIAQVPKRLERNSKSVSDIAESPAIVNEVLSPEEVQIPTEDATSNNYKSEAAEEIYYSEQRTVSNDYEITSEKEKALNSKAAVRKISRENDGYTIYGTVVSASDNYPIPGVTVIQKGTKNGVITDVDGNFAITVPNINDAVLVFTYLGYMAEEVPIDKNNELYVELQEELLALDEVVVVGYGVQKKSDVTGSIASVEISNETAPAPSIIHSKPNLGMREFRKYIEENVNYNNLPEFDEPVTIKLRFNVSANGILSSIKIEKSVGDDYEKEAIRLLKEGPEWIPASKNGIPFEEEVNLKIKFQPKKK